MSPVKPANTNGGTLKIVLRLRVATVSQPHKPVIAVFFCLEVIPILNSRQ